MSTQLDQFGRIVSCDDAGNYTVTGPNGLEISGQLSGGISAIVAMVNSMRPSYAPAPPPENPVPQAIDLWKAKVILSKMPKVGAGPTLLDDANALAAQVGGGVNIFWQNATEVSRDDALLSSLAGSLGITGAGLDALFVAANGLTL